MGLWKDIKNAFLNEATEPTTENTNVHTVNVSDSKATWRPCSDSVFWQLDYAFIVVKNILCAFLANVDWDTYKKGEVVKEREWFRFNVAPNKKETSTEFFYKLATKLVDDGQALIIETASKEFFIADSYNFKNGQELLMKENTFVNVEIGNTLLNRSFKENETCMFIKTPNYGNVDEVVLKTMGKDFGELKKLIQEGAEKALGMKLSLNLGAQAKNKYDDKYISKMQEVYNPLMKARDAVFITYKGEVLSDLTEKQRGSEVQQVLEATENNIKINQEILCNVGMAFGIPRKFMTGEFTSDNESIYGMAITMFGKPYLTLLSKKFTYYLLTEEDIINGGKIKADLNSIKFIEKLSMATAIDKLIGSGAYNRNEVREMLDDDPVEDGDVYYITKNYAVLSEYTKGGNQE